MRWNYGAAGLGRSAQGLGQLVGGAQQAGKPRIISMPGPILTPGNTTNDLAPFEIYRPNIAETSSSWRTFRVHTGLVIGASSSSQHFKATNDDTGVSPLTFTATASWTKYPVWLDITHSIASGVSTVSTTTAVLASGGTGWTAWPATLSSTHWYYLIAEIDTSDDVTKTATIYQYIGDNIRLPFFVPDPTVSPNPDATGCIHVLLVQ